MDEAVRRILGDSKYAKPSFSNGTPEMKNTDVRPTSSLPIPIASRPVIAQPPFLGGFLARFRQRHQRPSLHDLVKTRKQRASCMDHGEPIAQCIRCQNRHRLFRKEGHKGSLPHDFRKSVSGERWWR
jgi:hypothetical protein